MLAAASRGHDALLRLLLTHDAKVDLLNKVAHSVCACVRVCCNGMVATPTADPNANRAATAWSPSWRLTAARTRSNSYSKHQTR